MDIETGTTVWTVPAMRRKRRELRTLSIREGFPEDGLPPVGFAPPASCHPSGEAGRAFQGGEPRLHEVQGWGAAEVLSCRVGVRVQRSVAGGGAVDPGGRSLEPWEVQARSAKGVCGDPWRW